MPRILNVDDLIKSIDEKGIKDAEGMSSGIGNDTKDDLHSPTTKQSRMLGPQQRDPGRVKKSHPSIKPISRLKVAILLLVAIFFQWFLNTKLVKSYLAKYISTPTIAVITTIIIFSTIVGGLFYLMTN